MPETTPLSLGLYKKLQLTQLLLSSCLFVAGLREAAQLEPLEKVNQVSGRGTSGIIRRVTTGTQMVIPLKNSNREKTVSENCFQVRKLKSAKN